jgi:glycosyltransferase involved in cell wall biosynthesis
MLPDKKKPSKAKTAPAKREKGTAKLSAVVLTKDSAETLGACLASLDFADEVLVVDSKSRDASREIAKAMGARVIVRPWPGYTQQRNFALSQCKHDWVLSVDSDEVVTPELAQEILEALRRPGEHRGFLIPERIRFFQHWLRWGGIYPGHHLTLFNHRYANYGHGAADVHEGIQVEGLLGKLTHFKLHHAYPSFRLALRKLNRYTTLEAEGRWQHGIRPSLYGLFWRPMERFFKNYIIKLGFLDGLEGFLYCYLTAHYSFVIAVKLYERERTGKVM